MVIWGLQKARKRERANSIFAALWVLGFFVSGCGPSLETAIEGTYRIDTEALSESDTIKRLGDQPQRWTLLLGRSMLSGVQLTINNKNCARHVAGRRIPLDCTFLRVDKKKTVVYRSVDSLGRIQFLRATRTERGVDLEIDGRSVPLLRMDASQKP